MRRFHVAAVLTALCSLATLAPAQDPGMTVTDFDKKKGGSEKVHRLANVAANTTTWKAANVELEQDPNRPYAYISGFVNYNAIVYDIRNTAAPKEVFRWTIENPELHRGIGAMDGKYFKINGRYYYAQSYQFMQGTPDANLGAVIFDVTGLPDASKVKIVARINMAQDQAKQDEVERTVGGVDLVLEREVDDGLARGERDVAVEVVHVRERFTDPAGRAHAGERGVRAGGGNRGGSDEPAVVGPVDDGPAVAREIRACFEPTLDGGRHERRRERGQGREGEDGEGADEHTTAQYARTLHFFAPAGCGHTKAEPCPTASNADAMPPYFRKVAGIYGWVTGL